MRLLDFSINSAQCFDYSSAPTHLPMTSENIVMNQKIRLTPERLFSAVFDHPHCGGKSMNASGFKQVQYKPASGT